MKLHIPRDMFDNPTLPRLFLCQTNKEKIGELPAYDTQLEAKWNSYSELSFTINRMYNDVITGETKVHPLFDLAEGLRKVYVEGFGYFVIQDPDIDYSDNETKKLKCFSIEYETGQKYLENFFINTGEEDSVEVTYYASKFGNNYFNQDKLYEQVNVTTEKFDKNKKYYIKTYDADGKYIYEQIAIKDEGEYAKHTGTEDFPTLYVQTWPNVQFYNESTPQLSLLNLVFKKIPEWEIGHVDSGLRKQERKFEESRVAVYDFLMNNICDTFKCVIEWDTINMTVNFYEEEEDGITEDGAVQTRFDTDVFISRENLANSINIKYSTDDIKTKLRVSGEDGLHIREVNLGQDHIMNLDYYHTVEWMGQDLYDKYAAYKTLVAEKSSIHEDLMKKWVKSHNKWNDLMNTVPEGDKVLLVGDPFKKLYCTYDKEETLINKLKQHGVQEDTEGIDSDNVLLTLKKDNDSATIRVYCSGTTGSKPTFTVKRILTQTVKDGTTIDAPKEYSLSQWVNGELTAEEMGLIGFTVSYIGTLGAYLCLVKDESKEENLKDYGVVLLRQRQGVYSKIHSAQTEKLLSQVSKKETQCIIQDNAPTGEIPEGTIWVSTADYPLKTCERKGGQWVENTSIFENEKITGYALYKENYDKLQAVQKVLKEKEREATYWLDGFARTDVRYNTEAMRQNQDIQDGNGNSFEEDIKKHFDPIYGEGNYYLAFAGFDASVPIFKFNILLPGSNTTCEDGHEDLDNDGICDRCNTPIWPYAIYLKNDTSYISYPESQGALIAQMEVIASKISLENNFTEEDWARLSPFIKEDEFTDSNFGLSGYESEENRLEICRNLKKSAEKELKTLSQPSLEFSMDMANILAIPEFAPIKENFALGNFVTVGIRPDYIKKSRILEVSLSFDDISSLKVKFGNLVTAKSEIDKHAELLQQAISAGKSVATNGKSWQKAVDKSNSIDKAIREGLKDAVLEVGAAHGQDIIWDQYGIWGRKLLENSTDTYEPEQFKIINNKILFSDDSFKTAKALFGKFQYDSNKDGEKETHWGVLADALVGGYIEGSEIHGGTLEIGGKGGKFVVNEDGSWELLRTPDGGETYYDAITQIQNSRQYHVQLSCDDSTILTTKNQSATITCRVFEWDDDITDELPNGTKFYWKRSSNSDSDASWNANHITTKSDTNKSTCNQITITNDDVVKNSQFTCQVEFNR